MSANPQDLKTPKRRFLKTRQFDFTQSKQYFTQYIYAFNQSLLTTNWHNLPLNNFTTVTKTNFSMKKLLLLLPICFVAQVMYAQNCQGSQSSIDLHGNNIQARIQGAGDLFTDHVNAQFIPNPGPPGTLSPATIFAAGIWMGGVDPGVNLKIAAVDYRSNTKFDYTPGPLTFDGVTEAFTCSNWDRHFRVTGDEIAAFRSALPLSEAELINQYRDIAGWPGRGNPHFASVWGFDLPTTGQALAPFNDNNFNGLYEPLDGDYPVVQLRGFLDFVPAEIVWCVFNDQNGGAPHSNSGGKALQVEMQLTAWAFNCSDQPVLNNTIFTSHKIINRATERLDSTFLGIWVDVDLGCYQDDYIGCNPAQNTMYAYNTDVVDGQPGNTCSGIPTFPDGIPTQSVTILNHPLDGFIHYNNASNGAPLGTTDPSANNEYYNYLTGSWKDGTPFTSGGTGYNPGNPGAPRTAHCFPDDPADPAGWSMCSAGIAPGDRRMLGTTKLGEFLPGQIEELVTAWAVHPNPALPCGIGTTLGDVKIIQESYDQGFTNICSPLRAAELPAESMSLFPNPTSGVTVLHYGKLTPRALRAFDATGKLVLEKTGSFESEEINLETAGLNAGVYTLQIVTEQGTATKKLVVIR